MAEKSPSIESASQVGQSHALGGRWLWRAGAGLALAGVLAVLYWGAVEQAPQRHPFHAPDLVTWLLGRMPHPGYGSMPMVPVGSAGGLVPRGLCATPEDGCGGLEIAGDGRALLRSEGTVELLARVRHFRETGHLFAVSAQGEVWQLTEGDPATWERARLPAAGQPDYGKGGSDDSTQLLVSFDGHTGPINAASFSPDGGRVITASDDGTARIWEVATGAAILDLKGHGAAVTSVAFSPDGALVVTASDDGTARLWDAASGGGLATLEGHGRAVWSAAFSPDGRRVVTGSMDGTAQVWDAATGAVTLTLAAHGDWIRSVAFSPDGTEIVTASDDGTARLWDISTGAPTVALEGHDGPVFQAAFSPDGTRVVTTSTDGMARVWDASSGAGAFAMEVGPAVTSAGFTADGQFVLTVSSDGTVRIAEGREAQLSGRTGLSWTEPKVSFSLADYLAKLLSAPPESAVRAAAFSPDGTRVFTAFDDGTARIWSLRPLRAIVTDLAADGAQTLWIVGRDGFAAQIGEGAAQPVAPGIEGDLLGVAALARGRAVAVGTDGLLVRLQRAEGAAPGQGLAPQQQAQQQEIQQQAQRQLIAPAAEALISTAVMRIETAGERDLHAVHFLDEQRGWISGDDGLLLHTEDGGETWQALHEAGDYRLSDVHIQANGLGWAAGERPGGRPVVLAAEQASNAGSWAELPHHVAPWWFLAGIPALIFAGLVNAWAWRLEPPPPAASITGAGSNDRPLSWRDPDARVLRPVARGLSRFLRNVNSEPPLTIAITGRWGSGKSSLMNLLQEDLCRYGARPVGFNAWHHREEEHLLAALFAAVRRQGPPGWWLERGLAFRLRLLWLRGRSAAVNLAYLLLFAAILALTVRLSLPGLDMQELFGSIATWLGGLADLPEAVERYAGAVLGSGGAALLALWLRTKMVALPADPAQLMAALSRRARLGDFSAQLSFRDRFGEQFSEVCRALRTRRSPGLVILIDDLDRCQPEDTLKILEAVNYFVSAGPCIVVLGMDRRQVEYCVGLGFEKLVEGLPEDELLYEDELTPGAEEGARKAAKQRAYARHYLEKLINIEVPVPELTAKALEGMLVRPEAEARAVPSGDMVHWWRRLTARLGRRAEALPSASGDAAPAARAPLTEPPAWLEGAKVALATGGQVARVGVLAFVLGWLVVWGLEQVLEWPVPEAEPGPATEAASAPGAAEQVSAGGGTAVLDGPEPSVPEQGPAPNLVHVVAPGGFADGIPSDRRWVWWSPTVLALLIAGLWGVGAFIRQERQVIKDSTHFREALRAVQPLLEAVNPTPRAIKRYQNRMRYLAERLRPQEYEPGAIDVFLHWFGRSVGRSIVPDVWFQNGLRTAISEPALILLGAVETWAPRALEQPAEQVLACLDLDQGGEPRAARRREIWRQVKADFERRFAEVPDT